MLYENLFHKKIYLILNYSKYIFIILTSGLILFGRLICSIRGVGVECLPKYPKRITWCRLMVVIVKATCVRRNGVRRRRWRRRCAAPRELSACVLYLPRRPRRARETCWLRACWCSLMYTRFTRVRHIHSALSHRSQQPHDKHCIHKHRDQRKHKEMHLHAHRKRLRGVQVRNMIAYPTTSDSDTFVISNVNHC